MQVPISVILYFKSIIEVVLVEKEALSLEMTSMVLEFLPSTSITLFFIGSIRFSQHF